MSLTILNLGEARAAEMAAIAAVRQSASRNPQSALEAASPALFYGQTASDGYRRISQATSGRDLTPPMQDRMQAVSYYLYVANPLARRIVELLVSFVVGEGVTITAEDPAVQQVLDEFWNDPVNNLDINLESYERELSIFGEQLIVCPSNPINGAVRLGYVDPSHIEAVEYSTLEMLPGRAVAVPIAVLLRRAPNEREARRLTVVHLDEDPLSPTFGQLTGECFYWAVNKARAASRGISDLFAVADWVDGYDQMLFALMSQVDSLSRFIWDVELAGMTADQIKDWLKENGASPRANSIRAHNERVKWAAVSPSIQAADKSEVVRLIKNFVLGGAGYPEHWFADGSATNRATALEQGEPTLKMLTSRQRLARYRIATLCNYAIDQRIAAGVLPERVNRKFTVVTPELSVRDLAKAATALQSAAAGLVSFQSAAVVDQGTMARVLAAMTAQIGVDVDPAEMLAQARAEATARELRDYELRPPPDEEVQSPKSKVQSPEEANA
jgi:hypothetical protein